MFEDLNYQYITFDSYTGGLGSTQKTAMLKNQKRIELKAINELFLLGKLRMGRGLYRYSEIDKSEKNYYYIHSIFNEPDGIRWESKCFKNIEEFKNEIQKDIDRYHNKYKDKVKEKNESKAKASLTGNRIDMTYDEAIAQLNGVANGGGGGDVGIGGSTAARVNESVDYVQDRNNENRRRYERDTAPAATYAGTVAGTHEVYIDETGNITLNATHNQVPTVQG